MKLDVDSLRRNHKEFIKTSRLILGSQQIFKRKKHSAFTEKADKVSLSANDDKRRHCSYSAAFI